MSLLPSSRCGHYLLSRCSRLYEHSGISPLVEVRPSVRAQRHVVEQLADIAPMVQILDSPEPQMVAQLLEVFRLLETQLQQLSLCPQSLQDPGPPWVEAVTVGYVAAAPPSLVVSLVAEHDNVDQATVQFLLQQSLLAHAEEEEKAREEAEVKELEKKVDRTMEQLAEKVREVARRDGFRLSLDLSDLERTACAFVAHSEVSGRRRRRGRRGGGESGTGLGSWSAAPHDASSTLLMTLLGVFFGPLFLAVTCSVRRLRSICVDFSRR